MVPVNLVTPTVLNIIVTFKLNHTVVLIIMMTVPLILDMKETLLLLCAQWTVWNVIKMDYAFNVMTVIHWNLTIGVNGPVIILVLAHLTVLIAQMNSLVIHVLKDIMLLMDPGVLSMTTNKLLLHAHMTVWNVILKENALLVTSVMG